MKIKNTLLLAIIFILIFGCKSEPSNLRNYFSQGLWMFHEYTYEDRGDFCIGFVQGAGVTKHHNFIFQIYKSKENLLDSTTYWKINGTKVPINNSELLDKDIFFANESYYTDYYGKKIAPSFVFKNKTIMEIKDSIFLTPPINIKILINDSVVYHTKRSRRQDLSLNPQSDKISILLSPSEINLNDKTILSLTYYQVRANDTIKNPEVYKLFIENPKDNMSSNPSYVTEVNRYVYLENDIKEYVIPKEFFSGLIKGKGVFIKVYSYPLKIF